MRSVHLTLLLPNGYTRVTRSLILKNITSTQGLLPFVPLTPPSKLATTLTFNTTGTFSQFWLLYKWNHMECSLSCLVSFIEQLAYEIHLCCCMYITVVYTLSLLQRNPLYEHAAVYLSSLLEGHLDRCQFGAIMKSSVRSFSKCQQIFF